MLDVCLFTVSALMAEVVTLKLGPCIFWVVFKVSLAVLN